MADLVAPKVQPLEFLKARQTRRQTLQQIRVETEGEEIRRQRAFSDLDDVVVVEVEPDEGGESREARRQLDDRVVAEKGV